MVVSKTRLIYTAGTFAIPSELAVCRRIITLVSVLRRPPTQEYQNERSNPPKGFLGYVGLFINSYCERILPLEFDPQAIFLWDNPQIQLYYTTLCSSANVVDSLVALGAVMTPPAILIPTTPSPAPFQGCPYTILKFKLLFGTRIQVDTIGEEVVACTGIVPTATVPDFGPPPAKYPPDQARDEDPPRSLPEEGELPGDTAPATPEDPEASTAVPGSWLLTWTLSNGSTASGTYAGLSTDTFALISPGSVCTLAGSSDLVKNGSEIVEASFNCNPSGFVSTLISAVFTPA